MALLTIAEATKRYNNPLVQGVAQTIVDQDPLMGLIPWNPIAGDTQKVNWETTLGGGGPIAVNATISSAQKDASSVTTKYFSLVSYVAQAEIDDLIGATSTAAGVDPMVYELESKAKNLGRQFSEGLAQGTVTDGINSMKSQTDTSLQINGNAEAFALKHLDAAANALKGPVDFFSVPRKIATAYKQLLRAQGGATETVIVQDPYTGKDRTVLAFEGIPMIINDYLTLEEADGTQKLEAGWDNTTATTDAAYSIFAGRFDDGSKKTGVSMIYPGSLPAGLVVKDLGNLETKVATGKRIQGHLNFVNFAKYGLARVYNVK